LVLEICGDVFESIWMRGLGMLFAHSLCTHLGFDILEKSFEMLLKNKEILSRNKIKAKVGFAPK
jgi:hypothetical protein